MIKLKHIDPRVLSKELDSLDKNQAFYCGFMLGGCRTHSPEGLKLGVRTVQSISLLLESQLINLSQRNGIIEMCCRLDIERLARFTQDINSIAQNTNLSDVNEAVRSAFERVSLREAEKREKVEKVEKVAQSSRTLSTDTVIIQADQHDQKKIYQELARERAAEEESLELARKMMIEEQEMIKRGKPDESADCSICYGGLYDEEYLPLDCGHVFHKGCLEASLKNQIQQKKFPLLCPDAECHQQMLDNDAKTILKQADFQKYQHFSLAAYVDLHGDEFSWCPTADCRYVFFYRQGQNQFECQICKKHYCLKCRVQWHTKMTCEEYETTKDPTKRDLKFQEFVKGSKFKQCPKCKFWVAKDVGCDSMTCRCGAFFCYKCGKQQAYSHGPCECNNGAGQFGNVFARPAIVPRAVAAQRKKPKPRKPKR